MKKTPLFILSLLLFFHANSQSSAENILILHDFSLYFDFAKSVLTSNATQVLDSAITEMQKDTSLKAYLIAYTDSVGTEKRNLQLSKKRVETMANYFLEKNIASARIITQYKGELYESEEDLGLNRKGRIVLLGAEKKVPIISVVGKNPSFTYIKGKITDTKTKKPIPNVLVEVKSNKADKQAFTGEDGRYNIEIEGDSFSISANVSCYFFVFQDFQQAKDSEINIQLEKMRKGAKLPLQDIVFVGDKAEFLPEAKPGLKRLLNLMQENPNLKVEIGGHINGAAAIPFKYTFNTDPDSIIIHRYDEVQYEGDKHEFMGMGAGGTTNIRSDEDRFFLSLERARAVRDFLRYKGIDNKRITYKGYSGTQMKYPYPRTPDQEKMNRRVEITVLESECQ